MPDVRASGSGDGWPSTGLRFLSQPPPSLLSCQALPSLPMAVSRSRSMASQWTSPSGVLVTAGSVEGRW